MRSASAARLTGARAAVPVQQRRRPHRGDQVGDVDVGQRRDPVPDVAEQLGRRTGDAEAHHRAEQRVLVRCCTTQGTPGVGHPLDDERVGRQRRQPRAQRRRTPRARSSRCRGRPARRCRRPGGASGVTSTSGPRGSPSRRPPRPPRRAWTPATVGQTAMPYADSSRSTSSATRGRPAGDVARTCSTSALGRAPVDARPGPPAPPCRGPATRRTASPPPGRGRRPRAWRRRARPADALVDVLAGQGPGHPAHAEERRHARLGRTRPPLAPRRSRPPRRG